MGFRSTPLLSSLPRPSEGALAQDGYLRPHGSKVPLAPSTHRERRPGRQGGGTCPNAPPPNMLPIRLIWLSISGMKGEAGDKLFELYVPSSILT